MAQFLTLDDMPNDPKTVILRVDLNVPMQNGMVMDRTRLERLKETLTFLSSHKHRVVMIAHFGRPNGPSEDTSLRPVVETLKTIFPALTFSFCPQSTGATAQEAVRSMHPGQILVLENLRFHAEEETNDPIFAQELAKLGDVYVNDAFSCSHRAHASIVGITDYLPAYAGRLMEAELYALHEALGQPKRPLMAIVGGSKISTKLEILHNLRRQVDYLFIAGGMANTFLAAKGISVGKSLVEHSMLPTALTLLEGAHADSCSIILPEDATAVKLLKPGTSTRQVTIPQAVEEDDLLVDVGSKTLEHVNEILNQCATVVWNGPLGVFEMPPLDHGTYTLAKNVASRTQEGKLVSIAGGGDTVAALHQTGFSQNFSYLSTAGGAFLEWLEGKELPGVNALKNAYRGNLRP